MLNVHEFHHAFGSVLSGDISETPRRLQIQEEHREVHQREH